MRDKYLGKDGIMEKYNFRGRYITWAQNIGMASGYIYSICNIFPGFSSGQNLNGEGVEKVLGGFLVGTLSYFLGNYMHKVNEKKKEKALKNLEGALEVRK